MTLLLTVLNKLTGTRYHEPPPATRIAAFFRRHLAA
jgi:hypothetical protein